MPRTMRVEYPGAIYHVMDRGDRREDIFVDDVDRQDFLKTLGSEEFRQKMLELMEGKLGENHSGELRRETSEQKGNRIIAEELARLGWQESDLASRRKAHPDKLAIALRLRNETTLSIKWIAARVRIGSSKGAKSVLHRWVHGQDETAAVQSKACAQLEFQSTV